MAYVIEHGVVCAVVLLINMTIVLVMISMCCYVGMLYYLQSKHCSNHYTLQMHGLRTNPIFSSREGINSPFLLLFAVLTQYLAVIKVVVADYVIAILTGRWRSTIQ